MGRIVLRLDRMMVERKMSLNELAARVGISNVNLSKIKNNRVTAIRFSTLAAICEALDCEAGDILEFRRGGGLKGACAPRRGRGIILLERNFLRKEKLL